MVTNFGQDGKLFSWKCGPPPPKKKKGSRGMGGMSKKVPSNSET